MIDNFTSHAPHEQEWQRPFRLALGAYVLSSVILVVGLLLGAWYLGS